MSFRSWLYRAKLCRNKTSGRLTLPACLAAYMAASLAPCLVYLSDVCLTALCEYIIAPWLPALSGCPMASCLPVRLPALSVCLRASCLPACQAAWLIRLSALSFYQPGGWFSCLVAWRLPACLLCFLSALSGCLCVCLSTSCMVACLIYLSDGSLPGRLPCVAACLSIYCWLAGCQLFFVREL